MSRTWALIPIKDRERCKTRLAAALSPGARLDLVRSMLSAVLAAACRAKSIHRVIVISPERDRVPPHIPVLADTGRSLNGALIQAHSLLRELGRIDVVVLPADLPNISAAEIDALVQAGRRGGCAIAPDTTGAGTNALCLTEAVPFRFQFGPHSCQAHLEEARRLGLDVQMIHRPGLAFDVDSPADLDTLEARSWDTHLWA
jgi:2-phospho-L-lactate guanylyltransferase